MPDARKKRLRRWLTDPFLVAGFVAGALLALTLATIVGVL